MKVGVRFKVIATDGVFSMDGDIAKLNEICNLAEKYDALVMVDVATPQDLWENRTRNSRVQ